MSITWDLALCCEHQLQLLATTLELMGQLLLLRGKHLGPGLALMDTPSRLGRLGAVHSNVSDLRRARSRTIVSGSSFLLVQVPSLQLPWT